MVKLKLSICLIKYHTKKVYGKLEIQLHTLLSLAVDGGEWSVVNGHGKVLVGYEAM